MRAGWVIGCFVISTTAGTIATAGYPGSNGDILFTRTREGVNGGPAHAKLALFSKESSPTRTQATKSGLDLVQGAPQFNNRNAAYAPDGRNLVFASDRHGPEAGRTCFELYFTSGESSHRKTHTFLAPAVPANADYPSWSPDGTRIAYIASFTGGPAQTMELRLVDVIGSRILINQVAPERPAWSPDGGRITVVRWNQLWDFQLTTQRCVRLTGATDGSGWPRRKAPAWSPDGRRLAFSQQTLEGGPWSLWWMNADGSQAQQLTHGENDDTCPEWSPDGTRLVYVSNRGGSQDLYCRAVLAAPAPGGLGDEIDRLTVSPAGTSCSCPSWRTLPGTGKPAARVSGRVDQTTQTEAPAAKATERADQATQTDPPMETE